MNKSEKFWNRIAKSYDQFESKDEKIFRYILEKTYYHFKSNDVVLDFGCGTGSYSNEIAGKVKSVHAIDTSLNMIELAVQKADSRNIKNVKYTHTNIFDEKLIKGSYDAVTAFYILHLPEDINTVIIQISKLLRPGGLFISTTPCMGQNKVTKILFSIAGKTGLIPVINPYKTVDLKNIITANSFQETESEILKGFGWQYYFAAKKK